MAERAGCSRLARRRIQDRHVNVERETDRERECHSGTKARQPSNRRSVFTWLAEI